MVLAVGALTLGGAVGAWGLSDPVFVGGHITGSRSAQYSDQIVATDGWSDSTVDNPYFRLSWDIYEAGDPFLVEGNYYKSLRYTYTVTMPTKSDNSVVKDLSHIIFQVTDDAYATTDYYRITNSYGSIDGPKTFTSGGSNPNMPGKLFGIKYNVDNKTTEYTFSFETFKAPTWGNFYAKDGTDDGTWVTAWNAGFLEDPGIATDADGFIVTADTRPYGAVPLPGAALLLGAGLSRLICYYRKKK